MQQNEKQIIDYENPLKSAFFTLREIHDPFNKLEKIKAELMDLIVEAQSDTFDKGVI